MFKTIFHLGLFLPGAASERPLTTSGPIPADLRKFDRSPLIKHGSDDQKVPIDEAGCASDRLVPAKSTASA